MQTTTTWNYSAISTTTLQQSLGFTVYKRGCPYYVRYSNGNVTVLSYTGHVVNTIVYPLHRCTVRECKAYILPLLQNGKHCIKLN